MRKSKLIIAGILSITINVGFSQIDLSMYNEINDVQITSSWGDIKLTGTDSSDEDTFALSAYYTDISKETLELKELSNFISFTVKNKKLYIKTREPKNFESIDLAVRIPNHLFIEITLKKGGNIYANNFVNGIEINSFNGSVKIENIRSYAFVNAANGEIEASFNDVDKSKPISLVTMNGGVTVRLPKDAKRDIRLISRKNGYVESNFNLNTDETILNLNQKQYSKKPIINSSRINGGGALLFLSTENGPIKINKKES
jgi:hypothetical protein